MTRKWISPPRVEGIASRQAHANLPPGTYERELGREGFYGPATQMIHRHPPTGWRAFDGPLRPRAFDTTKLTATRASPWDAAPILGNEYLQLRVWHASGTMDHLVRNGDGDALDVAALPIGVEWTDYVNSWKDAENLVDPGGSKD